MIDLYAPEGHYLTHMLPVWDALPAAYRGTIYTDPGTHVGRRRVRRIVHNLPPSDRLTVVCSQHGLNWATSAGRPTVVMQHGAGQTYVDDAGLPVPGGDVVWSHDQARYVVAHLVPGTYQQTRRQELMGDTVPVLVVGCPKLDRWHDTTPAEPGLVVVSTHWANKTHPETMSALPHHTPALPVLAAAHSTAGHGHPRGQNAVRMLMARGGIGRFLPDFTDVLNLASVYVADNTSTLFEFAATGRPVVVLNAPGYRRDRHHGLRFWTFADIGTQVDNPADLPEAVAKALTEGQTPAQAAMVDQIYGYRGTATARAVEVLTDLADHAQSTP